MLPCDSYFLLEYPSRVMGLRETNWHQAVMWKRVGIEDKAKATHEGVSYVVGHPLWYPVHTEFLWRVLGLGTP